MAQIAKLGVNGTNKLDKITKGSTLAPLLISLLYPGTHKWPGAAPDFDLYLAISQLVIVSCKPYFSCDKKLLYLTSSPVEAIEC